MKALRTYLVPRQPIVHLLLQFRLKRHDVFLKELKLANYILFQKNILKDHASARQMTGIFQVHERVQGQRFSDRAR